MNQINVNNVLGRDDISNEIKQILQSFDENCKNVTFKKGSIFMAHRVQVKHNLWLIY